MNCARSVVELITLYWPHSIDLLRPERASVEGFRPIFFSNQGNVLQFPIRLWLYQLIDVYINSVILRGLSSAMVEGIQSSLERTNVGPWFHLRPTISPHQPEIRYSRSRHRRQKPTQGEIRGEQHNYVSSLLGVSLCLYNTLHSRTLYESKGLEFNDVRCAGKGMS